MTAAEIADWAMQNTKGGLNDDDPRVSYQRVEVERLAQAALDSVPQGGTMVEIGVFCGRSTSALLWVAREREATLWAADPFVWESEFALWNYSKVRHEFKDVSFLFYRMTSERMRAIFPPDDPIDMLHIDGDHFDAATDCRLWLPNLKSGGLVVIHDVVDDVRSNIYQVYLDVQKYTSAWETLWWARDEEGHQMCRRKP